MSAPSPTLARTRARAARPTLVTTGRRSPQSSAPLATTASLASSRASAPTARWLRLDFPGGDESRFQGELLRGGETTHYLMIVCVILKLSLLWDLAGSGAREGKGS